MGGLVFNLGLFFVVGGPFVGLGAPFQLAGAILMGIGVLMQIFGK